jgi:magnesium transporter
MRKFLKLGPNGPIDSDEADASIFYYTMPEKDERTELRERWGIDRHDIEASLDADEVPRVEFVADTMSLFWKRPTSTRQEKQILFNVASIGLFLRQGCLIVVASDDHYPVKGSEFCQATTFAAFILRMLHHTIQHYYEHLKVIKMISRELQGKIESSRDNQLMLSMFSLNESLIYYLNALESDAAVLRKLEANPEKLALNVDDLNYLEDLQIDHEQCRKLTEIYGSVLAGMVQARSGVMNNNMNVLLKKLTIINLVFLPLNLLAGIGGMSEYTTLIGNMNKGVGYVLAVAIMGFLGWATWWLLSRYVDDFNRRNRRRKAAKL